MKKSLLLVMILASFNFIDGSARKSSSRSKATKSVSFEELCRFTRKGYGEFVKAFKACDNVNQLNIHNSSLLKLAYNSSNYGIANFLLGSDRFKVNQDDKKNLLDLLSERRKRVVNCDHRTRILKLEQLLINDPGGRFRYVKTEKRRRLKRIKLAEQVSRGRFNDLCHAISTSFNEFKKVFNRCDANDVNQERKGKSLLGILCGKVNMSIVNFILNSKKFKVSNKDANNLLDQLFSVRNKRTNNGVTKTKRMERVLIDDPYGRFKYTKKTPVGERFSRTPGLAILTISDSGGGGGGGGGGGESVSSSSSSSSSPSSSASRKKARGRSVIRKGRKRRGPDNSGLSVQQSTSSSSSSTVVEAGSQAEAESVSLASIAAYASSKGIRRSRRIRSSKKPRPNYKEGNMSLSDDNYRQSTSSSTVGAVSELLAVQDEDGIMAFESEGDCKEALELFLQVKKARDGQL